MFVSTWGSLGKANISEQRDGRVSLEFYFTGFYFISPIFWTMCMLPFNNTKAVLFKKAAVGSVIQRSLVALAKAVSASSKKEASFGGLSSGQEAATWTQLLCQEVHL